jgi:pilus assembly protein FimV
VQPLAPPTPEEAWYKKTWLLAVAGVGLLGLVLLGLMNFMRRPKAAKPAAVGAEAPALDGMQDEEHDLLDRLAMHPDDTATHLELVSLYYARQDVEKFEDAAQAMYAHLGDTDSAEWEQIKAMGQELAPHNPLFSDHGAGVQHDYGSHPTPTRHQAALDDDVFADVPSMAPPSARPTTPPPVAAPAAPAPIEDAFDFDLTDHSVAAAPPPPARAAPVEDFTLNMPAMDFDKELAAAAARVEAPKPAPAPAPVAPKIEDDFAIGGEDATGTKLDLAKAYLDMGDPEGARSMLEEVLTEGNANQKSEASRLLKEIR